MKQMHWLTRLLVLGALAFISRGFSAEEINITKPVEASKFVPVAISGFSPEIASVIRFDLKAVGFKFVSPEAAQYLIEGGAGEHVAGRLLDAQTRAQRLGREYSGGVWRQQAHAFSDEIVKYVRGIPGIAQTKIAFRVQRGGASEVYIADYDGANAHPITADHSLVAAPCWAPGGRTIYYTSYRSGFPDIYKQDIASGNRTVVAAHAGLNTSPAVSPDGRFLAMILSERSSPDLYVADPNGGSLRRLTRTREDESSPCWAPDSRTICFTSRMSGLAALYTASVNSPYHYHRIRTGTSSATEPSWSPDGKNILFTVIGRGAFQIYMISPEGGLAEPIAAGEDPSWSPNSRTAIIVRRERHRPVLSLLDAPTKAVNDIHLNLGNCSEPAWAR